MADRQKRVELFVPGRLCIVGEHSDWAAEHGIHEGHCLVIGTDQGISAWAAPSDRFTVESLVPDEDGRPTGHTRQMDCVWDAAALRAAAQDPNEFFRYCAGTACQLLSELRLPGGIELHITGMDLPLQKGVSSSAAVCILVAEAFNAVYKLGLFPHEMMEAAYHGEQLTGSQCGRMDQACIYGKTPVLLTFHGPAPPRIEPVFPAAEICMFFVDLAGRKDTVKILADLQAAYVRCRELQEALGPTNERTARAAYEALTEGDGAKLGALLAEAQENFDRHIAPHSPKDLASPLLHELLRMKELAAHVYGGKGVGSQGDGTAQFVACSAADRDAAMAKIEKRHPKMRCFPLTVPSLARPGR